jgi:SAM-dependent methyltransferase
MMMHPPKTSAALWHVILTGIILLAFTGVARSQTSGRSPIDEEIAKQEKIYNSRGLDVPQGYVTGRGLSSYVQLLPGFCGSLGALGSSDRWLDIGAGAAQAILDYYAPEAQSAGKMCSGAGGRVRAVAISIEDRRTEKWRRRAASLDDGRIQYLAGRRLRQYAPDELGKFQIITDVFGGFSYTDDLSGFVERALRLLDTGGVFYTLMQSVHLENGSDNPKTSYLTEMVDAAGRDQKVCSWLKHISCVEVTCESKSNWQAPTELINIRKVCGDVSVPHISLLKYEAGDPPGRRFQIEP